MERTIIPGDGADSSVRLIRAIAVVMIFSCHVLEGYGSFLAWWLNCGVQVFLFMSGYMFGGRRIHDWGEWWGRRLSRLLPPYYLLIVLMALAAAWRGARPGLGHELLASLGCMQYFLNSNLPGCDHLWFISLILLCYLTIPILQALRDRISDAGLRAAAFFLLVPAAVYALYKFSNFMTYAYVANLTAFAWGYYFGTPQREGGPRMRLRLALPLALPLTLALLAGRGIIEGEHLEKIRRLAQLDDKLFVPWSKVMVGVALFLGLHGWTARAGSWRAVRFVDRYSYEIYLTHHVFLFGPLALEKSIGSPWLLILVVIVLTAAASVALNRAAAMLQDWIQYAIASYFSPPRAAEKPGSN